ncbi:outer membrane protein assembly factor BamB family protein [Halocalculus aciditolerans]|uniref:Pyrrolo-quinoline quinone repeat domain-containing protein n=1 Tax=Halocalculus aciditolerans TaxID=1383812 RepID=A0A830F6M2_9EURY|nr:PQQ-binding-like beta-propeller repeat protein [Halocalculus aciditolerans]GGL68544.1 hypothetical protein GCM10009039_28180 [Halocalculus aciditolerans]
MRTRTAVAVLVVMLALGGVAAYGLTQGPSGSLSTEWVSDTSRANEVNHHPLAVGTLDGEPLVVAPVSSVAGPDAKCSFVAFDATGATRWTHDVDESACAIHGIGDVELADATGDGTVDVLAPTTEEVLYALDARDGSVTWTANLTAYGYAGPTVLTDPERVVVQPDTAGVVFGFDENGSTLWRHDLDEYVSADTRSVTLGDGRRGVAVGSSGHVTVFDANGTVVWQDAARATWLETAEIDGERSLVASGGSSVTVFSVNGTERWERDGFKRPALHDVVDGDGDGVKELYLGSGGDTVAALNARTGETEWETTLSTDANILPAPVVGDLDGDGETEVVAATNDGVVHVLDAESGEVMASSERDVSVWVHPTLADLDGDGQDEILVMYGDGRVVALSYEGDR